MDKPIIMYESDEAARLETREVWVARDGRVYHDENTARYAGSTHKKCERCDAVVEKGMRYCQQHREELRHEKWLALPEVEWDGQTPLYSDACEEYFFDEDDILEHLEEHDITAANLDLQVCEPVLMDKVDMDWHFEDDIPEDADARDVLPAEVIEAFVHLNRVIEQHQRPISWIPGKHRTSYSPPTAKEGNDE